MSALSSLRYKQDCKKLWENNFQKIQDMRNVPGGWSTLTWHSALLALQKSACDSLFYSILLHRATPQDGGGGLLEEVFIIPAHPPTYHCTSMYMSTSIVLQYLKLSNVIAMIWFSSLILPLNMGALIQPIFRVSNHSLWDNIINYSVSCCRILGLLLTYLKFITGILPIPTGRTFRPYPTPNVSRNLKDFFRPKGLIGSTQPILSCSSRAMFNPRGDIVMLFKAHFTWSLVSSFFDTVASPE